jgi:hypothetical protein
MTTSFEIGLDTFGDITRDAEGRLLSHAQVLRHGCREDRDDGAAARPLAIQPQVQRRHAASRGTHEKHRVDWHHGRTARPGAVGVSDLDLHH